MTPQPGTAGTGDDPLDSIETKELVVNGQTIDTLVGLAFDSANQTDGVLRFDGSGSTNGITDGSAKVLVNGTVHDVAGAEWVDQSGTKHTVDSWEKVVNSQFDVSITGTNGPVKPGNTLDVTVDVTNNGTDSDTQTVTLSIDNGVGQVGSASVTLSGGGSVTETLSWSVPSGQTEQNYTATVASADDTASQTVTVASATVPSSVVHQYRAEDFARSWPDNVGSADMSVSGVSASTFSNGEPSATSDGVDDFGRATGPETIPTNQTWGVALTVNYSAVSSGEASLFGVGDGSAFWDVRTNASNYPSGAIGMFLSSGGSNAVEDTMEVHTTTGHDGTTIPLIINKNGDNRTDVEFYITDMSSPEPRANENRDNQFDHTAYSVSNDLGFFARHLGGGSFDNHRDIDIGVLEFNTAPYSQQERLDFVSRRPEV